MVAKRPAGKMAATVAVSAPKKPRVDPAAAKCQAVAKGVQAADHAPKIVQEMLVSMLESSLLVFKEERHQFQQGAVDMVGDLFAAVEAGIVKKLEDAEAQVAGADEEKAKREGAVKEAEEQLAAQTEEVSAKKQVLADAAQAFRSAKEAVSGVQAAQKASDKELAAATSKKDALQVAMNEVATPLIEGSCKDKEECAGFVAKLMPVLKKFEFSDSMLAPLPNMLLKDPKERGSFDTMLANQVKEEVDKCLARFDAAIKEAETAKASHDTDKQAADEKLSAAREAQHVAAQAFTAAQSEQKARELGLKAAKDALKELGPQMRQNAKAAERTKESLAKFREGPLAAFAELKDRGAPPPAEEQEEAAPAAEEPQAEPEEAPAAEEPAAEEAAVE